MNNKKLAIILLVVAVVGVGGFAVWKFAFDKPAPDTTNTTSTSNTAEQNNIPEATYTAAQVAEHNSENDCWTIVSGSVYNITPYVPMHPGGDEILLACGVDGTSLFTQRTTSDGETVGSGTPHDSQAQRQLARYQVGTLAN